MEEDHGNMRREAQMWCVGTLLVAVLATYTAWQSARHNVRLGQEMTPAEQAAPARTR